MTTKELKEWKNEMIHRINEENEKIKSELSTKILDRCNTVVVSKDFRYCVIDNEGCAGVKVMAVKDDAVRMTRQTAERIAREFHAENGNGKIEWQVMKQRDYLTRLLEQNNYTIELLTEKD